MGFWACSTEEDNEPRKLDISSLLIACSCGFNIVCEIGNDAVEEILSSCTPPLVALADVFMINKSKRNLTLIVLNFLFVIICTFDRKTTARGWFKNVTTYRNQFVRFRLYAGQISNHFFEQITLEVGRHKLEKSSFVYCLGLVK